MGMNTAPANPHSNRTLLPKLKAKAHLIIDIDVDIRSVICVVDVNLRATKHIKILTGAAFWSSLFEGRQRDNYRPEI